MAQDINEVIEIGRLTRDLGTDERSFGYTQSGVARASVDIAVNRSRKQGDQWIDEVSYFTVLIWGKTAENLKPYLTKGKQIAVKGFLKQERWEKDGQKNSRVVIVAEQCQLLGGKSDDNNGGYNSGFGQSSQQSDFRQRYENQQYNGFVPNNTTEGNVPPQNNQQSGFQEDLPYPEENIPF